MDTAPSVQQGQLDRPRRAHVIAIALIGFALRALFIWRYPAVLGGDTVLRMANPEHVLLSYQLPLPQLFIHLLHPVAQGPTLIRLVMSVFGALAGVAFYLFATTLVPATQAFAGALFLTVTPMILTHSTVPYQEIFLVGGVLGAFYGAVVGRWYWAAACIGVACLARYEAWLACPLLAVTYLHEKGWSPRRVAEAALLGCVPVVWIAFNRGISPPGSSTVDASFSLERFWRWGHLVSGTIRGTPVPVLLLAAFGAWYIWRRALWRERPFVLFSAFIALFLIAVLFSAHGVSPNPQRYVTAREDHIFLAAVAALATLGLAALRPGYRWPAAVACVVVGLWMTDRTFRFTVQQPELALSVDAARYLDTHMMPGERSVVLSQPITTVADYLGALENSGGSQRRAAGVAILNSMDTHPPGYQKILVNSRLSKAQLENYSQLIDAGASASDTVVKRPMPADLPNWVVRWSDFRPTSEGEERLAALVTSRASAARFSRDSLWVEIFRMR